MRTQLDMYKEQQSELLKKYNGRFLVMRNGVCEKDYDNLVEACRFVDKQGYKDGEFIVIECTPGNSAYTASFANNLTFTSAYVS